MNTSSEISLVLALKSDSKLSTVMDFFRQNNLVLQQEIESRPRLSAVDDDDDDDTALEYLITFQCSDIEKYLKTLHPIVETYCWHCTVINGNISSSSSTRHSSFPRTLQDLNVLSNEIFHFGIELDADHPGFKDDEYRKRRKFIVDQSANYQLSDESIPRIVYTDEEIRTWNECFTSLQRLYTTHACREYNEISKDMFDQCGYRLNNIPQLEDVSRFISKRTGFRVRPVAGLLSPRAFLAGLAFKVYHATQYMRHGSRPFYTPEPDICHELLGHLPLFADPTFAEFVHQIGLASLGASDEDTDKLSTCLWFTVEFGLCRQNGELRAFGGGLLSSVDELQYALSGAPQVLEFDPAETARQGYVLTEFQPIYYAAESIVDARDKMINYAASLPRRFALKFNEEKGTMEMVQKNPKMPVERTTSEGLIKSL